MGGKNEFVAATKRSTVFRLSPLRSVNGSERPRATASVPSHEPEQASMVTWRPKPYGKGGIDASCASTVTALPHVTPTPGDSTANRTLAVHEPIRLHSERMQRLYEAGQTDLIKLLQVRMRLIEALGFPVKVVPV